jgi:aminoglycoside phosphotransferase (APT) family kinase protein
MVATAPPTSADLQAWLGASACGRVTAWEQLTAGNSRTTWLATFEADDGDGARRVVVRSEAGDGPFSGTELSLRREATLYQALTGSGIRMPELVAFDTASGTFAMSGLTGQPVFNEQALDDLLAELGRLHRLDPATLDLPGFARSSLGDLELWAGVAESRIAPRSPLVDFALAFLRRHHPAEPQRLVLCHGDAGPGNFLHDGEQLTGLLDWEFAHLGDPLDDLAWITVRAILFGVELPDFARRAREIYAPAADVELDEERLRYWQAVVILRNLVTCLASTSNPVRGRDRLVHHMIVPPLQVMLVDALARIAGVELDVVEPVSAVAALPALPVIADIAEDITGIVDTMQDPAWRTRAKRMRLLLGQLAETLPLAPAIAQADAAAGAPAGDEAGRLQQLNAEVRRHLQLFPRAAPMASVPVQGF